MNPPPIPQPYPLPEPAGLFQALAEHPELMADLIEALQLRAVDTSSLLNLLSRIVCQAVRLFDGVDGAAVTAHLDTVPVTVASTDHRALILDSHQHADCDGPSRRAVTTDVTVSVDYARMLQVWPALAHTAALVGIGTITAVPLHVAGRPVATLNLYGATARSSAPDAAAAWSPAPDADFLTVLTFYAERGLTDFSAVDRAADPGRSVRAALTERTLIAQATGLLMATFGFSADYAEKVLADQAQDRHRTLAEQATQLLANHQRRPEKWRVDD